MTEPERVIYVCLSLATLGFLYIALCGFIYRRMEVARQPDAFERFLQIGLVFLLALPISLGWLIYRGSLTAYRAGFYRIARILTYPILLAWHWGFPPDKRTEQVELPRARVTKDGIQLEYR